MSSKTRPVGIRIPEELIDKIKESASRTHRTFGQWVVKAIKEKLNK
jgi:predicted DNA-binding protein